jgi:succinate dehydrogenase/fumarate reductase flavoprotein subunit
MNKPAIALYRDKGVELGSQMLEIAVCVQHNNGGLAVDHWWRSNIEGFFPAGEAAGTHGVYRPGGSALNSGQAGSYRAALYISRKRAGIPDSRELIEEKLASALSEIPKMVFNAEGFNILQLQKKARERMSLAGGMLRSEERLSTALEETKSLLESFAFEIGISNPGDISLLFRLKDTLISQYVYLSAMKDYITKDGKSRGSALYYDRNGTKPHPAIPDEFSMVNDKGEFAGLIQEITYENGRCSASWRQVHPIPPADDFFENVWRDYREHENIN